MRNSIRVVLLVVAAALAAGCQKPDQAATAPAAQAVATVPLPTAKDMESWKPYLTMQVRKHSDAKYKRPYIYFIPAAAGEGEDAAEAQRQYDDQLSRAQGSVANGILAGSLVAFAGPDSARTADVIVESFKLAGPSTLKNVRIVFIGAPADMERAKAAVDPSGAEFVFEEMK